MMRESINIVKNTSSRQCDWMEKVNSNIKYIIVGDIVEKTVIFPFFKIICIRESYINQLSPLFLASMFILWTTAIEHKSFDYSSKYAIESQLDFLICIDTEEASAIINHLREYYKRQ